MTENAVWTEWISSRNRQPFIIYFDPRLAFKMEDLYLPNNIEEIRFLGD